VDPDEFNNELQAHVAVVPIRGPQSTVTTASGVTIRSDGWSQGTDGTQGLFGEGESGVFAYTYPWEGPAGDNARIPVAPVATTRPNMAAPATAVRPSVVHRTSGSVAEQFLGRVRDPRGDIEIYNISQGSTASDMTSVSETLGDIGEDSNDEEEELPDLHRGLIGTTQPLRVPERAATMTVPHVQVAPSQPVLPATAPVLRMDRERQEPEERTQPVGSVERSSQRHHAATPTAPRRRTSAPTPHEM